MKTITVNYEHTDTFGGEANYSWVRRGTIKLPAGSTDRQIVAAVKRELEITGVRCNRVWSYGDSITLKPSGICQIILIAFGME